MRSRKLLALLAVALAPLLTACPGTEPDFGVVCVGARSGVISAQALTTGREGRYVSEDGGLTWFASGETSSAWFPSCEDSRFQNYSQGEAGKVFTLDSGTQEFRFRMGQGVDVRQQGSTNWEVSHDLSHFYRDARVATLRSQLDSSVEGAVIRPGPFDAAYDPASGNVVASMGHDGVLVWTGEEWRLAAVGPFGGAGASRIAVYFNGWPLLLMAGLLFVLGPTTAFGTVTSQLVSRRGDLAPVRALLILVILAACWGWWWFLSPVALNLVYPSSGGGGTTGGGLAWCLYVIVPTLPILLGLALATALGHDAPTLEVPRRVLVMIGSATVFVSIAVLALWLEGRISRESIAVPMAIAQAFVVSGAFGYLKLRGGIVPLIGDPFGGRAISAKQRRGSDDSQV